MKNIIIAILAFCQVVSVGVIYNAETENDQLLAYNNLEKAEQNVVDNFASLAERWGDDERCDTLLSNSQWEKINSHEINAEEAIALANLVEDTYEAHYWSYSDAIDDADFQMAVKTYSDCKQYVSEQGYNINK